MVIFLLIIFSLLSARLYRMGGTGGGFWGDTKWRDWGCPTMAVLAVVAQSAWCWALVAVWFLMWGAMTTYWKKGPKAYWYHWMFTGLGYSLSWTPFCYFRGSFFGLLCYTIVVTVFTTVWSVLIDDVEWEERGRGAIVVAATPLLLWR